jgi:hypothetical protein
MDLSLPVFVIKDETRNFHFSPSPLYRFWGEKSIENEGRRFFRSVWMPNPGYG